VAEGYRAPNLDDLAADNPVNFATDLPSLDVQPEHAWTYEVGLKLNTPRLRMQIAEFWVDLNDNILRQAVNADGTWASNKLGDYGTVVPGTNNFIRANFDCYVNGTELTGEYLLQDGWSVYGNAWYTYGYDLERLEPLSRMPPLQGLAGLRWRDEGRRKWFEVYTWLVARQNRYAAQNNIDPRFPLGGTPGYATLNARMGRTFGEHDRHRVTLGLENITDKAYRVLGSGVDGPGFNAIVGYEWTR
jgi:outer membrane receptor for ferrienterochelin and colicin